MDKKESRRDFLGYLMKTGLAASFGVAGFFGFNFVVPAKTETKWVDVLIRRLTDLPDGHAYAFPDFQGKLVTLLHRQGKVRAFSSVCPHLGCKVAWEPDKDRFFCPCHVGVFSPDGEVVAGPPPRPLTEFLVKIENGYIYVSLKEA